MNKVLHDRAIAIHSVTVLKDENRQVAKKKLQSFSS